METKLPFTIKLADRRLKNGTVIKGKECSFKHPADLDDFWQATVKKRKAGRKNKQQRGKKTPEK